jgi:hypothetical protein
MSYRCSTSDHCSKKNLEFVVLEEETNASMLILKANKRAKSRIALRIRVEFQLGLDRREAK